MRSLRLFPSVMRLPVFVDSDANSFRSLGCGRTALIGQDDVELQLTRGPPLLAVEDLAWSE